MTAAAPQTPEGAGCASSWTGLSAPSAQNTIGPRTEPKSHYHFEDFHCVVTHMVVTVSKSRHAYSTQLTAHPGLAIAPCSCSFHFSSLLQSFEKLMLSAANSPLLSLCHLSHRFTQRRSEPSSEGISVEAATEARMSENKEWGMVLPATCWLRGGGDNGHGPHWAKLETATENILCGSF